MLSTEFEVPGPHLVFFRGNPIARIFPLLSVSKSENSYFPVDFILGDIIRRYLF